MFRHDFHLFSLIWGDIYHFLTYHHYRWYSLNIIFCSLNALRKGSGLIGKGWDWIYNYHRPCCEVSHIAWICLSLSDFLILLCFCFCLDKSGTDELCQNNLLRTFVLNGFSWSWLTVQLSLLCLSGRQMNTTNIQNKSI